MLIIDDVLATGGTAAATVRLVEALGGVVVGVGVLIELEDLGGRAALDGPPRRKPGEVLRLPWPLSIGSSRGDGTRTSPPTS